MHGTGGQYSVKDAADSTVPSFTNACHTACLQLTIGQVVATISPPLFVWANGRCLTGAWCVLATTYSEDCVANVDLTAAGLAPMAALFELMPAIGSSAAHNTGSSEQSRAAHNSLPVWQCQKERIK
jgi:hypothetical protein